MSWNKIILPKEELYEKYINENFSQQKLADYFKVSVETIRRNLKEYNISIHTNADWTSNNEPIYLSQHQLEIIEGALLGDGNLSIHKNSINANFSYLSKSKEHVEFVCNDLLDFALKSHNIIYTEFLDKRTNKIYGRYDYKSIANITFTELYNKWYKDKKKIIPSDLILTPLNILIWYLGDGELVKSNTRIKDEIFLCTDSFTKEDICNILLPQLASFSPTITEHAKGQYRIRIPRIKVESFLNFIGPCPVKDYQYKWEIHEYTRKPLKYEPEIEQQIIKAYQDGCSPGTIATYFNRDRTTILNCLSRYGLDTTKNKGSKKKVVINNEE